jgi:hypothetical protein
MAVPNRLRLRRSAAQLHALVQVEREIRAADTCSRRKYLREFNNAYQDYKRVLSDHEYHAELLAADLILLGDYHALPKSQQFAAELVETLASITGRPVILGLETVFSKDQQVLDDWRTGAIGDLELREGIRFDTEWGYDWASFYEMLSVSRLHATEIVALDSFPRGDLRRIGLRDRHAAAKIAEAHERHPGAILVVLFGESHLAPNHLPMLVKSALPSQRVLTLLQNIDPLYWKAAGERDTVREVQVVRDVVCVFNSTPLEKYESYRLCIERWRQTRVQAVDLSPTFSNLTDALLRFLGMPREQSPTVYHPSSVRELQKLLANMRVAANESSEILRRVAEKGIAYSAELNTVFATAFQMQDATEEAARCVHATCSDATQASCETLAEDDRFYLRVLEEALVYFGSRVLHPARKAVRESELYKVYGESREDVERHAQQPYGRFIEAIDFIVLHRDYEANLRQYWHRPELLQQGLQFAGAQYAFVTRTLGQLLGTDLYDAYVAGRVTRRSLRTLFRRDLRKPGAARTAYFVVVRRLKRGKPASRRWVA